MSEKRFARSGAVVHDGQLADRLRQARIRQGYSQREVAQLTNKVVAKRTLAGWEIGEANPRLGPKLRAVAEVLGVPVAWLLWGENGGPPNGDRDHDPAG